MFAVTDEISSSWFCGGVDFLKPNKKYVMSDKYGRAHPLLGDKGFDSNVLFNKGLGLRAWGISVGNLRWRL